jgi:hypothetical protein
MLNVIFISFLCSKKIDVAFKIIIGSKSGVKIEKDNSSECIALQISVAL